MRTATAGVIWMVLTVISIPTVLLAQRNPATRTSSSRLLGIIRGVEVIGCGCYFQMPADVGKSERYIFFEDASEESALMNIEGANVKLKLVSSTEPDSGVTRQGERFVRRYASGAVAVRMEFVTTSVCAPNDESCESTGYDVRIEVAKGSRQQSVKAIGGCGC